MKPAAYALIAVGSILALGALGYSSLIIPVRGASETKGDITTWIDSNVWGQPLFATILTYSGSPKKFMLSEHGRYPHFVREGKWIRSTSSGGGWTGVEVWYIDGHEVTREEWERRK